MVGPDENSNHLFFFSLIFHANQGKISLFFPFFFSYFSLSPFPPYQSNQTQHTSDCQKGTNYDECFCSYFLPYDLLEKTYNHCFNFNQCLYFCHYHNACSLIHFLENATSLEAKKIGRSILKSIE